MVDAKELVERIKFGDERALATFFTDQTPRLRRLVEFRLNPRLRGRVDPDDVLQEAYLDAVKRQQHFTGTGEPELFVWFRLIVQQTLADLHRRHLGAQQRDANREVALHRRRGSATTSVSLAANLIGQLTSPTQAVRRAEVSDRLEAALDRMDAIDREVLALRHFEELSNSEVARELGIQQKAASIRYVRALRRLKEIMTEIPEFQQDYQTGI